jgi:3-phenylpropionate/trans-cinnamate dioxygenase ferredoxin reductase subunit
VGNVLSIDPAATKTRAVIIGAGLGGVRTAEHLRRRVFRRDPATRGRAIPPYDRPPLSKQFLRGPIDPVVLRSSSILAEFGLELSLAEAATALSVPEATVTTTRRQLSFDVAVNATGRHRGAFLTLGGIVLRTVEGAVRLRDALRPGRRIGIGGARLIGCEVAAMARQLGLEVLLVDVATIPCIRGLGGDMTERLARIHTEQGVVGFSAAGLVMRLRGGVAVGTLPERSSPASALHPRCESRFNRGRCGDPVFRSD